MSRPLIRIRGARQNNLKNLDLDIPLGSLVAVTGVSGSGKSSLAFDTLYAEGQRRYVESFSTYARQFLDRMDKPLVDEIDGIPPAIAIDQANPVKNSRSTVGTMTEINDHVKILFAKLGELSCGGCGNRVERDSPSSIAEKLSLERKEEGQLALVGFPLDLGGRVSPVEAAEELARSGFRRVIGAGGAILELTPTAFSAAGEPLVLVDRLELRERAKSRLFESLEQALRHGRGRASVFLETEPSVFSERKFSDRRHCASCDLFYPEPVPNLFSFNSPLGACARCKGFGRTIGIDMDLVVPDPRLTLAQGAVKPWTTASYREGQDDLKAFCRRLRIPLDRPWIELSLRDRERVFEGDEEFYGIKGFFEWLESRTYKMHIRVLLSKYRSYRECEDCRGTRLSKASLLYRIAGKTVAEIYALDVSRALELFRGLPRPKENPLAALLAEEIANRLDYLERVGLSYLTLDRQSRTLSGGEVQRVDLTTALGSSLVGALYVLDEPSIGLHPRDTGRLMEVLKKLRDSDNTIVVVEHDSEVIRRCDQVIDLGPGAGERGGEIVFSGPTSELARHGASLTGEYLRGERTIPLPASRRRSEPGRAISIRGARENNLKSVDVDIPLGVLTAVTGVSGSGKSTLVESVLYRSFLRPGVGGGGPSACESISGFDLLTDVVLVDQSPIGRTPRANAATYLKVYDGIRRLFASTPEARRRGLDASSFSFNVDRGRCQRCAGEGFEKIEMQFLSDVYVTCEACEGARFTKEVLAVRYRGKSIKDVLSLTVSEALSFFSGRTRIVAPLRTLSEVGLSYIRLGQSLSTLSGGEAQRLKLASEMSRSDYRGVLLLFDEPTTGLHFEDIRVLLEAFSRLLDRGASILVIEHNLDVIKSADWIVDLGPEGGDAGGRIVACGTPEDIAREARSHTGRFLERCLRREPSAIEASPLPAAPSEARTIRIRGARQHNLKRVDVDIPRDRIVVLTGLSGSGKSSLAFDIVFAEGQRRFLESLSAFARQYIQVLDKPEVDLVSGMPPTIAIEQRLTSGGRKSTVATVTEIYHYLRLLFAKLGVPQCVDCRIPIAPKTEDQILAEVESRFAGFRVSLFAPLIRARKGAHREVLERARKSGFAKLRIDGRILATSKARPLRRYVEHDIEALVAEVDLARGTVSGDVLKRALSLGDGALLAVGGGTSAYYNKSRACPRCERSYEEPDPRLFSFNSKFGACPDCDGMGSKESFDEELLVPDPGRSLAEGALPVFTTSPKRLTGLPGVRLRRLVSELGIDPTRPWHRVSSEKRAALLSSLVGWLEPIYRDSQGEIHDFLFQFRSERACSSCGGARLRDLARAVTLGGIGIHQVADLTPEDALEFLDRFRRTEIRAGGRGEAVSTPILKELESRLRLLSKVGLSYLQLSRPATTLSGGEAQRVRLAAQLGSHLRGVCYVLDEPTIGLHPRDHGLLLATLRELKEAGNSVLVVEHDEETIRSADHVIDLGPGGGSEGGRIVAQGTPAEILENPESVTGRHLNRRRAGLRTPRSMIGADFLEVKGAKARNLQNLDVRFPLERLTVVTGVSGSGKSTLVRDVLYRGLYRALGGSALPGEHDRICGVERLKRVLEVDQTPIGKTPRSIPASYVGFFDEIRRLFASTTESRMRGYTPGRFSFNVSGGRCEACAGQGTVKMEMSFLPNVYVRCESCRGRRFNEETLSSTFRGKNIHEVLSMTLAEAAELFRPIPSIHRPLSLLNGIGLDYLTLGQPSNTLSGGEAQRIKLAYELSKPSREGTLYVLDEPTTGLHLGDIEKLARVLHELVDSGATVVVIEHNLDVVAEADCVIDLGPEGGDRGGRLLSWGPPSALMRQRRSLTGRFLRERLEGTRVEAAS